MRCQVHVIEIHKVCMDGVTCLLVALCCYPDYGFVNVDAVNS